MALSLVYSIAMRVADGDCSSRVRVYVAPSGATYWATETTDIAHVCDWDCAMADILNAYVRCVNNDHAYIGTEGGIGTVDVIGADYGDDTYVLCAACQTELHRDDEAHYVAYGDTLPGMIACDLGSGGYKGLAWIADRYYCAELLYDSATHVDGTDVILVPESLAAEYLEALVAENNNPAQIVPPCAGGTLAASLTSLFYKFIALTTETES